MKSDAFGINVKQFCREHEARARQMIEAGEATPAFLEIHREKLRWLQHERLIHLIVLCLTAVADLFAADLTLLHPETQPGAAALLLVLTVLLAFYFAHYFFLENTTQRWYLLAEALIKSISKKS